MIRITRFNQAIFAGFAALAPPIHADDAATADATTLQAVTVSGQKQAEPPRTAGGTRLTVAAEESRETVNALNVEDDLKYQPSLLVRKRYVGDAFAPFATRTTGINASARTLIFADGIPLSTLLNNNNGNGSPQWFLVSPGAVDHIDVYYGPYEAAYSGNSYGAVVDITTRLPDRFEARVNALGSVQNFRLYATDDSWGAGEVNGLVGDRIGAFRWQLGFEHLNSVSQPITFETLSRSTKPAGAADPVLGGAFNDRNRAGASILVLGDGNITHTVQDSASLKLAYDLDDTLRAAYTFAYWHNEADTHPTSYLRNANGEAYYGAASGTVALDGNQYSASAIGATFSQGHVEQDHLAQALSIGSRGGSAFDWQAVASTFNYLSDISRASSAIFSGGQAIGAGRVTDAGTTGWSALDLKGTWRPARLGGNTLGFGAHGDHYRLASPVFNLADWRHGDPATTNSDSRGKTDTWALWLQDSWQFAPQWTATLGDRYEHWRAYDGYNLSTTGSSASGAGTAFPVNQPTVAKAGHSPKAALAWQLLPQWQLKASAGRALRFPTVGELYQNIQAGTTFQQANPFLEPEDVVSAELALQWDHRDGYVRATGFDENVRNALIAQTSFLPGYTVAPVSFVQNVDRTRQFGTEWVADQRNVLIHGLELFGSVTYVDAHIRSNSGYVPTTPGVTSKGKNTPYVPRWRVTTQLLYRPDEQWTFSVAGRYSTRLYATVDNTDVNTHTYQGFDRFLVVDLRANCRISGHWSAAAGIDNVNNDKYYLFHPFPQRTYNAELHYEF